MAKIKAVAKQTTAVDRLSEGADVYVRALRDGTLSTAAFFQALALEGRCFAANIGSLTTPATFAATPIDGTEPDIILEVPSGTTVLPISLTIQMEAYGTNAIFECMAAFGTGGSRGAATGGTAITPVNLRTDAPRGSSCVCYSTIDDATATYLTANKVEFFRDGLQSAITKATAVNNIANADFVKFKWSAAESGFQPVLIGASQLFVNAMSQAGTGFMTLVWAELPSSAIT
jgi:hypothetical protein